MDEMCEKPTRDLYYFGSWEPKSHRQSAYDGSAAPYGYRVDCWTPLIKYSLKRSKVSIRIYYFMMAMIHGRQTFNTCPLITTCTRLGGVTLVSFLAREYWSPP